MAENDVKPVFPVLIMAGGKGTRMGISDKGLLMAHGEMLIERNIRLLREYADRIYIATSPFTLKTEKVFKDKYHIIRTEGSGYSVDLAKALEKIGKYPIMVLSSDIYFADPEVPKDFIEKSFNFYNGITNILSDNMFCGVSIFFQNPEMVTSDYYKNFNYSSSRVLNINDIDTFKNITGKWSSGGENGDLR
ncbi:NTP transferase domain-containing protein [Caldiplasma sukawensis]